MRRAAWAAGAAALLTWLPLTAWRGLAQGRALRIGAHGQQSIGPLIEGMIQMGFVMLAPALFSGVLVFVLLAWREERRRNR